MIVLFILTLTTTIKSTRKNYNQMETTYQQQDNENIISVNIDFLEPHTPSLCIPRVFNNISETRIREVFSQLDLGVIERIDIIQRKNEKGEEYKRVFIHFVRWNKSQQAQKARRKLLSGETIKIVYDNPWFWKVEANKAVKIIKKPERKIIEKQQKRPLLVLDDNDDNENVPDFVTLRRHQRHYEGHRPRTDHVTQRRKYRHYDNDDDNYPQRRHRNQYVRKYQEKPETQTRETKEAEETEETEEEAYTYQETNRKNEKHNSYDDLDNTDKSSEISYGSEKLRAPKKKTLGKKLLIQTMDMDEISKDLYADLELEQEQQQEEIN